VPLDHDYQRFVERELDECNAALDDKPNLAAVFDHSWRKEHRSKMLNANSPAEVWYPSSYAKPHNDMFYPPDYQLRIEEGAAVLLPRLDDGEKNHLIARMRGSGCLSAEEELLLARGFARVFGADAISFPRVNKGQDVPEFHVSVSGRTIEVEAKGLMDSAEVQQLNEHAVRSGQNAWCSFSPTIGDVGRLRGAVARKLLSTATGDGRVLILTQYTPWIHPADAIPLVRIMGTAPETFGIASDKHALAVAYVTARWIAGVWFNHAVSRQLGFDVAGCEQIRRAIRESFYPRAGGVFFDETNSEQREQALITEMIRIAYGG